MRRLGRLAIAALAAIGAGTLLLAVWFALQGPGSRAQPAAMEASLARAARHFLIPRHARTASNPVASTGPVLTAARRHFADHCASCHGNDGRGQTDMGRALYPKAPDMTSAATQRLSDGELFWIIENGVKLTGMPAWGGGSGDVAATAESWGLVSFIRQLPRLSATDLEEMERYNPVSPSEMHEMEDEQKFLESGETPQPPPHPEGGKP